MIGLRSRWHSIKDRAFVATLAVCVVIVAIGVLAEVHGSTMPPFSAPRDTVGPAFLGWCTEDGGLDEAAGERYLALFTARYQWLDIGVGLILTALSVAAASISLWIGSAPNRQRWLRTPKHRWTFLVLGVAALVWLFLSAAESFVIDFRRMQLPTCADSIIIPLFETFVSAVVTIPIMTVAGWAITRLFGALPVSLDHWDSDRPFRSWIVTILTGAAMAVLAVLLVLALGGSMARSAPALVLGIYLLGSTRAALLSSPLIVAPGTA